MAAVSLPDPPVQLKAIQSYMKIASDIERVDPVVAYWVRLYSTETALTIDRESPECKTFLGAIIVWLESFKQKQKDNEAVSNQTVGQAHMENFVVALFNKADTLDRDGTANKNTVRMFYMAAVLFEAMAVFGPLTDDISKRAKYAKFKAAYIQKCLKSGQTPKPGPIEGADLENPTDSQGPPADDASAKPRDESPKLDSSDSKPAEANDNGSQSSANQDPYILTPTNRPVYPPSMPTTTPPGTPSKLIGYSEPPTAAGVVKTPTPSPAVSQPCTDSTTNRSSWSTILATKFHAINGAPLNAEDLLKGQKYCKFANSALQYDDIPTAVDNLQKALKLLTTGQNAE